MILPSETGDFLREIWYKIDCALVEKAKSAPPNSQAEGWANHRWLIGEDTVGEVVTMVREKAQAEVP